MLCWVARCYQDLILPFIQPVFGLFETIYPSRASIHFVINQALSCLAIHGDISVSVPHIEGSVHVGFQLFQDDLISIKPFGKRPSDIPASSPPFLAEFHPRKREFQLGGSILEVLTRRVPFEPASVMNLAL